MKLLFALSLVAATLTGVIAKPYLKSCEILGERNATTDGWKIQAQCSTGNTTTCAELDMTRCLANWNGQLWPSMHTLGNFNNTCGDCFVGNTKHDVMHYGLMECDCTGSDGVNRTSIDTNTIIRYEAALGMLCSFGNNSAVRSVKCTQKPPLRERQIRRSLLKPRPFRLY